MSAERLAATVLWTELVNALVADGIIPKPIQQSGPATTAVILSLAQREMRGPWIPMHITPEPGKDVVALDAIGRLCVISYVKDGRWIWNGSFVAPKRFRYYTHVSLDGVPT